MNSGQLTSLTVKGVNTNLIDIKNTQAIIDLIYPIGSVYVSIDSGFDPNTSFGGSWTKIEDGRYLRASSKNIGSNVEAGLPNVSGNMDFYTYGWSGGGICYYTNLNSYNAGSINGGNGIRYASAVIDLSKGNSIYGKSTTVTPASINVIIWKRVS